MARPANTYRSARRNHARMTKFKFPWNASHSPLKPNTIWVQCREDMIAAKATLVNSPNVVAYLPHSGAKEYKHGYGR